MSRCSIITCEHEEALDKGGQHICGDHARYIPRIWKSRMTAARRKGNTVLQDQIYRKMVKFVTERLAGIA